jgi:GNAT superfamily N-acetyltransferase
MMTAAVTLRMATVEDVPTILGLITALAEYERLQDEVVATEDGLRTALFGTPARAEALLAEIAGSPVGFALWFYSFSTFQGRHGLFLEDIFVDPAHRGAGIGRMIFRFLAQRAVAQGCGRMDWDVLNWNSPAIRFYRSLGAQPRDGWTRQRLTGHSLEVLAHSSLAKE